MKASVLSKLHHFSPTPQFKNQNKQNNVAPKHHEKQARAPHSPFSSHPNRRTMTSNKKAPKLQPQLNYRRTQPTLKRLIAHKNHTSNKHFTDANHITLQHMCS